MNTSKIYINGVLTNISLGVSDNEIEKNEEDDTLDLSSVVNIINGQDK